jgi:hypothetical protein
MRHRDIDLTMNTHTDPEVLDRRGALSALPALQVDGFVAGDVAGNIDRTGHDLANTGHKGEDRSSKMPVDVDTAKPSDSKEERPS